MIVTILVQNLLARGFDFWKKRRRKYAWSEFLDPVLYALPVPLSFMTMCFFPVLDTTNLDGPLIGVFILLGLCVFLLLAFVLASFALYFYPAKERFPQTGDRIVQLIRILCMSLAWLALNMPASPYIRFVVGHTPLSENSILTLLVPLAGETISIIAAVACSNLIPYLEPVCTRRGMNSSCANHILQTNTSCPLLDSFFVHTDIQLFTRCSCINGCFITTKRTT